MYVCKLLTQIQCVGPCLDILTIIKRFVATGSVEVARASTGKLRNERKQEIKTIMALRGGHRGPEERREGHHRLGEGLCGHGEGHHGCQPFPSDTGLTEFR